MKLGYWCFILVLAITCFGYADIIHVPGDQPTIQAGIDAAQHGDTVLVANGTYTGDGNKNLDFKGKAITVTSENGAEVTIIDCESDGRGFFFHSGETEESVVSGFTITHGYVTSGAGGIYCENFSSPTIEENIIKASNCGIFCSSSSPIIQHNEIIDNHVSQEGGGIFCRSSSPTIQNNNISENSAGRGGGVFCEDSSSPVIINNTISGNSANDGAGGIHFLNSSPTIENNEISGNHGGGIKCGGGGSSSIAIIDNIINGNYGGSGINCSGGDVSGTIQDNEINSNTTTGYGGGICSEGTNSLIIQKNVIIDNGADYGAGIYCSSTSSAAIIQNNEISLNEAKTNGGGICCRIDASPTIINNIISENFADGDGGGICCWENSSPTIISNVINKNFAYDNGAGIYCYDTSSPMIQNNEISLNSALYGGGIYCYSSSPQIINNTVSGNSSIGGGGISCWYHSYPKITNTILWSDFPYELYVDTLSEIDITYSDIQGAWPGEGNIDADPLFIDPDSDFHLSDYSPCIGSGIKTPDILDTDIEGNPRPNPPDSNPDVGAYENPLPEPILAELPPSIIGKDGVEMVLIPAGEFSMGDHHDVGDDDEKPIHTVYLDDYYIDVYEVTNAQYAKFLNKYGKNEDAAGHELLDIDDEHCLIGKMGNTYKAKPGYENHPIVMVKWYGAAAYAQFYGKRLPTEAEWEKAVRGGLARKKYPWGSITRDEANYAGTGTSPVGSFAPNSYGLYDMIGNVREWCADEYDRNYYNKSPKKNPKGPGVAVTFRADDFTTVSTGRVTRGGGWSDNPYNLRCAGRSGNTPDNAHYVIGFRCAQDIEIPITTMLEKVSGDNQSGNVSSTLPNPFVVRVLDQKSKPLYGVAVNFEVSKGASVKQTQATTNEDGEAQTVLTLGAQPGEYNVTASVKGLDPVVFTATASCEPCEPCHVLVITNTLVITGTVYRQTQEVAEDGLHVEVNIITQRLTSTDTTGKTVGKGQYSVTFVEMQKPAAKAGDEILVTVKDADGKLLGQSRHTLTAAEVEAKETRIDVLPCQALDVKPVSLTLHKGINVLSVPVKAEEVWRMSDLAEHIGKDNLAMIIRYDYTQDKFISYLPTFPDDSKANATVKANEGYIVVMKADQEVEFEAKFSDDEIAAPLLMPLMLADNQNTSIPSLHSRACFVVTGNVRQQETGEVLNEIAVTIRNLRTGQTVYDVTGTLAGLGNYVATFVAPQEEFMMHTYDKMEITAQDANHRFTIEPVIYTLTPDDITNWTLIIPLRLSLPKQSVLLQNYPNPFNPETWIPFQLAQDAPVTINIYDIQGQKIKTIALSNKNAGIYTTKDKAAYWDGRDNLGEKVSSGIYFYTLQAGEFRATRKMAILK